MIASAERVTLSAEDEEEPVVSLGARLREMSEIIAERDTEVEDLREQVTALEGTSTRVTALQESLEEAAARIDALTQSREGLQAAVEEKQDLLADVLKRQEHWEQELAETRETYEVEGERLIDIYERRLARSAMDVTRSRMLSFACVLGFVFVMAASLIFTRPQRGLSQQLAAVPGAEEIFAVEEEPAPESVAPVIEHSEADFAGFADDYVRIVEIEDEGLHETERPLPQLAESEPEEELFEAADAHSVQYEVKRNDNLWNIARDVLGDPLKHTQIAEDNDVTRETLRPGMILVINLE